MAIRKHTSATGQVTYHVYVNGQNHRPMYVGRARTKEEARALERREKDKQFKIRNGLAPPDISTPFETLARRWVEECLKTHRRGKDDKWRLEKHLVPTLGELTPQQITVAKVKELLKHLRNRGTGKTTMRACVRLLGRFLNELFEEGVIATNPVAKLDRHTRRQFKPDHDPRKTPFLRAKEDIRAVYVGLPDEELRTIFAVGVFAGLRTGEILGLRIEDLNLAARHILVQRSYDTITKDEDPRIVPINHTLLPILTRWLARLGRTEGLVFNPSGHGEFIKAHRLREALKVTLEAAKLPALTWYQATRHTFASHWVMDGRPIEKLRDVLGHSSVIVTERYAHLAPEAFSAADFAAVAVDLNLPEVLSQSPVGARREGSSTQQ